MANKKEKKAAKIKTAIKNLNDAEKQRAITWLAYIGTIALAVLTSCLTLIFDIEHFDPGYFFCQLAFNIAFSLIMLILSLRDGRLGNENRKSGELFELRREYKRTICQVVDEDSFREWNDQLYEKERQSYVMGELAKANINDYQYLLVSDADLLELTRTPKENVPYRLSRRDREMKYVSLDQITQYQYEVIKIFRQGKYTFNKINHSFFKSANGRNEYKYYADTQDQDKKAQFWGFFYRILMIVIFSAIMALAVVNPTQSSGQTVAYETLSRIFNVLASMFFGYSLAHDEMRRAINRFEFIIRTIGQYLADVTSGIFVAKNRDEIIKAKLEEIRLKRLDEQEKHQESIESALNEPKNEEEGNSTVADEKENAVDSDTKKDSADELEVSPEELPIVQQVLESIRGKKETK